MSCCVFYSLTIIKIFVEFISSHILSFALINIVCCFLITATDCTSQSVIKVNSLVLCSEKRNK